MRKTIIIFAVLVMVISAAYGARTVAMEKIENLNIQIFLAPHPSTILSTRLNGQIAVEYYPANCMISGMAVNEDGEVGIPFKDSFYMGEAKAEPYTTKQTIKFLKQTLGEIVSDKVKAIYKDQIGVKVESE